MPSLSGADASLAWSASAKGALWVFMLVDKRSAACIPYAPATYSPLGSSSSSISSGSKPKGRSTLSAPVGLREASPRISSATLSDHRSEAGGRVDVEVLFLVEAVGPRERSLVRRCPSW